eukprot:TRINITY_DN1529_c0_g1_i3.p1 TRINITY_DN1529_c0_g1~~TRINITY_DN1529_c0_g1_i3.p1  ORF type:complete len:127 (-),score=15.83 TRINITY_DN1529_c0_g1_i3:125-505(-)
MERGRCCNVFFRKTEKGCIRTQSSRGLSTQNSITCSPNSFFAFFLLSFNNFNFWTLFVGLSGKTFLKGVFGMFCLLVLEGFNISLCGSKFSFANGTDGKSVWCFFLCGRNSGFFILLLFLLSHVFL